MKNKILVAFALILFGLPAFSKANFSYVAVNNSQNLVGYHANSFEYNTDKADVYSFSDDAPLYQLQTNTDVVSADTSAENPLVASNFAQSNINTSYSKGNVDYITVPSKNKFSFGKTAGAILGMAAACALDPYVVEFGGNKYIMILDNFDGIYNENDIIGINDTKNNIFSALKKLDVDGDNAKLTSKELKDRGVRFVKIDKDGKLAARDYTQDLSLDSIVYIDLTSLKKVKNIKDTGIFGKFDILIKDKNESSKIVKGHVTYELNKNLVKLF